MFRRGLIWLPIACAPAFAACSLLLDDDGFTDPPAQTPSDAGTSSADSPANDDGSVISDAPPGGDTSTDAGFVCPAATVSFCDDFNRDDVKGNWKTVSEQTGGSVTIVKPDSTTSVLQSVIPQVGSAAQLATDFPLTPQKFHIELTLEIGTLPSTGAVYLGGIMMLNPGGAPSIVYLYCNGGGVFFAEQVAGVDQPSVFTPVPFTVGTKHRVIIDYTFGGNALLLVDGDPKIDRPAKTFLVPKSPINVYLGGSSLEGKDLTMRIDDFVFTAD